MAETSIGWTATRGSDGRLHPGFTFNPWIGCTEDEDEPGEQSPECGECYAREGQNHRVSKAKGLPLWGAKAHRQVTSVSYWKQPLRWNAQARELGVRLKVFCASLCDLFEDFDGPLAGDPRCWGDLDDVREGLWPLIEQCDWLDFLLLTKRPQNVSRMVPAAWLERRRDQHGDPEPCRNCPAKLGQPCHPGCSGPWPRNVWLGATAGTKKGAARRLPHLLAVPGGVPVFFVSYEPALEGVDFRRWIAPPKGLRYGSRVGPVPDGPRGIDWLIVGGESGKRARHFDLAWARAAVAACQASQTPVFVKQMGTRWAQAETARVRAELLTDAFAAHPKGEDPAEWPEDLRVQTWPEVRR